MSVARYEHLRPATVTVVVAVMLFQAVAGIAAGIALFLLRHNADVLGAVPLTSGQLAGYGIGSLVVGLITGALALALGHGSNVIRYLVAAVSVLWIAGAAWAGFRYTGSARTSGIVHGLLGVTTLVLLFTQRANEFFTGRA